MCCAAALAGCRRREVRTRTRLKGSWTSGLGVFAAAILLSLCSRSSARSVPKLSDYCPPGQLTFKSVDNVNSACTPGAHDEVGQAVFQCWQQFVITINGCQVTMRTAEDQLAGPGRLPCRMFGVSGNLTGEEGIEAQMWADVDGPALLSYYSMEPEAVAALQYDNSRQLVRDIWAFMRRFTNDLRFDNDSWIDQGFDHYQQQHDQRAASDATAAAADDDDAAAAAAAAAATTGGATEFEPRFQQQQQQQEQRELILDDDDESLHLRRRQQLVAAVGAALGGTGAGAMDEVDEGDEAQRGWLMASSSRRRERHGPMRVYRSSETRVVVKVPTGCKYRYNVNPTSHVFDSPTRHHAHIEWRTILLTVAALSTVLAVLGLGTCTYFSHRHAVYVASYWEYQAVKDQLGSELPPSTYLRLFGEEPKSAAAAAAATAAALAAARAARGGAAAATAAPPQAAAPAAAAAPPPPQLSSAIQQHPAAGLSAQAASAPQTGAGEPDGTSSQSSNANGSGLAAVAANAAAAAALVPVPAAVPPPVMGHSS
ncbi:hypothetical protein PLESTM_001659600 [Pleodorina starrii]|nr:hypothetical protein PLESTM_001659600 [Pleodorina starrii]